jgi:DNA-binding transcriptional ArsR family regulator
VAWPTGFAQASRAIPSSIAGPSAKLAVLVQAAMGHRWIADSLMPTPTDEREPTFGEELARIRETPAETVRADLTVLLARLLGSARAGVLVLLDTPKSTTQLVALTGQALGSVGRHLKVLLDARLVQRRRAGRSVLYYRTAACEALVKAQQDG